MGRLVPLFSGQIRFMPLWVIMAGLCFSLNIPLGQPAKHEQAHSCYPAARYSNRYPCPRRTE